ncbi:MAG: LamG domain-containing protein, partial [Bdellovibrio sp.]
IGQPSYDDAVSTATCYKYQYQVTDNVNNVVYFTSTSEAKVDLDSPTAQITGPGSSTWHSTGFTADFSYSDTGGSSLQQCEYTVLSNGVTTVPWTSAGNCAGLDSSALQKLITVGPGLNCRDEGQDKCEVKVRATDAAGNPSAEDSRLFSIDFSPPIFQGWVSPIADSYYKNSSAMLVEVLFTDSGSGISDGRNCNVTVSGPGGTWVFNGYVTYQTDRCSGTITLPDTIDGAYSIRVNVTDDVGNTGSSTSRSFNIDSTPPPPGSIASIDFVSPNKINVTANIATDSGAGPNAQPYQFNDSTGTMQSWQASNIFSDTITWVPNQEYCYGVHYRDNVTNPGPNEGAWGSLCAFSPPNTPLAPNVTMNKSHPLNSGSASASITVLDDGNNATTTSYAVYEAITGQYVDWSDGSFKAVPVWGLRSQWNNVNVNMSDNTYYKFFVNASFLGGSIVNGSSTGVITLDRTRPNQPTLTIAQDYGNNQLNLSWNSVNDEAKLSLTTNLSAYFDFNENTAPSLFDVERKWQGTINGGAFFDITGGILGGSLYFDGSSYVSFADDVTETGYSQITMEAWINWSDNAGAQSIMRDGGNPLGVWLRANDGAGNLVFQVNDTDEPDVAVQAPIVDVNEWHHIVGVYDGDSSFVGLYVDGILVAQQTTSVPTFISDPNSNFQIGAGGGQYFKGYIDELRVIKRALTPEEINESYMRGRRLYGVVKNVSAPLNQWPLNGWYDNFGDGDWTANPAWVQVGSPIISVINGQLVLDPLTGSFQEGIRTNNSFDFDNMIIDLDMAGNGPNYGAIGIGFDYNPTNNDMYILHFNNFINNICLSTFEKGSIYWGSIGCSSEINPLPSTFYHVTIKSIDNFIKVYVDGVQLFNVINNTFTSGKIFLTGLGNSHGLYDNITIIPLTADTNISDHSAQDNGLPNNPGNLISSSHTPGTWSPNPYVTMNWDIASDTGNLYEYNVTAFDAEGNRNTSLNVQENFISGINGYDIGWDTSQTCSGLDGIVDLPGSATSNTSDRLAEGNNYYFCIQSKDNVGNLASAHKSLGPYMICNSSDSGSEGGLVDANSDDSFGTINLTDPNNVCGCNLTHVDKTYYPIGVKCDLELDGMPNGMCAIEGTFNCSNSNIAVSGNIFAACSVLPASSVFVCDKTYQGESWAADGLCVNESGDNRAEICDVDEVCMDSAGVLQNDCLNCQDGDLAMTDAANDGTGWAPDGVC